MSKQREDGISWSAVAGTPFHFKQWGEHDASGERVGKKAAGHLLDGVEHRAFPKVAELEVKP